MDMKSIDDALVELLTLSASAPHNHEDGTIFFDGEIQSTTDRIIQRPLYRACQMAIREIGEQLHERGKDIEAVAKRVLKRAPDGDWSDWANALGDGWRGVTGYSAGRSEGCYVCSVSTEGREGGIKFQGGDFYPPFPSPVKGRQADAA